MRTWKSWKLRVRTKSQRMKLIEISQRAGTPALVETVGVKMLNTCGCTVRLVTLKRESPEKLFRINYVDGRECQEWDKAG